MMLPGRRKSGRRTAAVAKYDAFEAAGLSPDELETVHRTHRKRSSAETSDEEFVMEADDVAEDSSDHEQGISEGEKSEVDIESAFGMAGEEEITEKLDTSAKREETHSRGLVKTSHHDSKFMQLKFTFGTSSNELLSMVHARDNWTGTWDLTFPSKDTLKAVRKNPTYGPGATFGVERELLKTESTKGWDWYYNESTGIPFRKRQRVERITSDLVQDYLPTDEKTEHTVIIGPAGSQKVYKLGRGQCFNFGEAWGSTQLASKKKRGRPRGTQNTAENGSTLDNPSNLSNQIPHTEKIREGWILSLGNTVQALSWAPNCPETQYLAIVVPITDQQKAVISSHTGQTPAFTPSPAYPSAIQIWSFESKDCDGLRRLDMESKPRLRMILCTDAGDIRRLCWCPMARNHRPGDETDDSINIGLLAGIWGDGTVKVLDVALRKDAIETEMIRVKIPAFEAKPPTTLCTCVTWLSPSDIAVGCANGFVAVWSISAHTREQQGIPTPYIYMPVQNTYILSIASAYPSYPHIIATTDVDGQDRLSSLIHPSADISDSGRLRMGSMNVVYSPFLRGFISPNEAGAVRFLPVRRFFSAMSIMKDESLISSIAPCSLFHPSVLVGTTSGKTIASNPFRKLASSKERVWQQNWFTHEYIPGKRQGHEAGRDVPATVESSGASKFYDGFKAVAPGLATNVASLKLAVFEEGTAVTALSWNPNEQCAGWASAGLGCGLIRVEDLSH
ncbi:hypothetical protein VTO42DRAFT_4779 [Malbranchea cinnamomea]